MKITHHGEPRLAYLDHIGLMSDGTLELGLVIEPASVPFIAFRQLDRLERVEVDYFTRPTHSECVNSMYPQRWNGEIGPGYGGRPDLCPGCREDHDPGDEG